MATFPFELNYKVGLQFEDRALCEAIKLLTQEMGFDDSARYEVMVETADGQRTESEVTGAECGPALGVQAWPLIHQVQFANTWIKDLNVKLTLVRRAGSATLAVKGESDRADLGQRLALALERHLQAWQPSEGAYVQHQQERERLFGAMLLVPRVAGPVRELFLKAEYAKALQAGYRVLVEVGQRQLGTKGESWSELGALLEQDPPRLLFPDRSGASLRRELDALAHLLSGATLLLQPLTKGQALSAADPGQVLKYLVLISLLVERLEAATPNPAVKRGGKRSASKTKLKPKAKAKPKSRPVPKRRRPAAVKARRPAKRRPSSR